MDTKKSKIVGKKWVRNRKLLLIFAIPLFLIFVCEIFLRVAFHQKFVEWSALTYMPDRLLGHRYFPDTTFVHTNIAFTNICKTNSYGLPGPNFDRNKKEGIYRILVVGNSDETGFYCDSSTGYVQLLKEIFEKEDYPVEVINCSINGLERDIHNNEFIRNECVSYNPDLILRRNNFPLTNKLRYRETYKGYSLIGTNISQIESFKQHIDQVLMKKIGKDFWFKLYDISYIFRYYMKIYFDSSSKKKNKKFVDFSEKLLKNVGLRDLRLYVRKESWISSRIKEYDIWMCDLWTDTFPLNKTWKDFLYSDKIIKHFSSETNENGWLDIDITDYLQKKISDNSSHINFLMFCRPSADRYITFASMSATALEEHMAFPIVQIFKRSTDSSTIYPSEAGYLHIEDQKVVFSDSVIMIKNRNPSETTYGLLKFDISNVGNIEKASLKLYVKNLSFGTGIEDDRKEYTLSESADILNELHKYLENRNVNFILYDTYMNPLSSKYVKSYANRHMKYFSLEVPYKDEYAFGKVDGHSSLMGHQAIADALFEKLVKDIIPAQYLKKQ